MTAKAKALLAFTWTLRLGLAGIMLYAAVPKLSDVGAFAAQVDNYRMVPAALLPLFSAAVPSVEVFAALGLCTPWLVRGAALSALMLFASFAIAMAQAILRGINLDCGCFGGEVESLVSWWTVLRSVALALGSGWVLAYARRSAERNTTAGPDR